jgi:hypothetical protein
MAAGLQDRLVEVEASAVSGVERAPVGSGRRQAKVAGKPRTSAPALR